jgi:hypothetical protein
MMAASTLRVRVDRARVERATAELETALAAQNVAFAERFEHRWFPPDKQRVARAVALVVCALGVGLSLFLIVASPPGCSSAAFGKIFFGCFGILALAFFRIFDIQASLQSHSRRWTGGRLRKHASKNLAAMLEAAPLEIEYTLDDGKIAARWIQEGKPEKSWQRDLGKFAYVGDCLCAIFPKRRSFYPTVLVLHSDSAALARALEAQGVEVGDLPEEIPHDYGLVPA